jgi:uncharacterized membrane protein
MNKRFCAPCVMLALALVGTSIAFYDAYVLYNVQPLWCPPPINGCNEVANSPYARIFDLPVGYYGVVYYLYMFGLAALLVFEPFARALRLAALGYAARGCAGNQRLIAPSQVGPAGRLAGLNRAPFPPTGRTLRTPTACVQDYRSRPRARRD